MSESNNPPLSLSELRTVAEKKLAPPPEQGNEALKLLHELQVHRVELEIQNSELRETRHELETMLEKYTDLFDFAPVGYITLDRDGVILSANFKAARLIGRERYLVKGRKFKHFVDPVDQPIFKALLQNTFSGSNQVYCEVNLVQKTETRTSLQLQALSTSSGQECRLALIDITELKRAKHELQVVQKHKMESLGQLAGGIAHNFNNNLAIILGNIDLSLARLSEDNNARPLLANARIAVLHSRDLVQNISTFSRKNTMTKRPLSLPLLIDETLGLLEPTIPSTVKFTKAPIDGEAKELTINGNSTQIQEALINLCNNAVHAMNEQGEITLTLQRVQLEAEDILPPYHCESGNYAKISIQDSGTGMTPEVLDQIFDPFFTTKGVNVGTGMGLATVQGILIQHAGLVKVISTPGQGSCFELYFPILANLKIENPIDQQDLPRGHEKILFVDDDCLLAESWGEILSSYGYQVTIQTNSLWAMGMFKENPHQFDLIISDQTMPELSGKELIAKALQIRPDIPVILCTGHSNLINAHEAKDLGIKAFCRKPLTLAEMLQTTRAVLDGENQIECEGSSHP